MKKPYTASTDEGYAEEMKSPLQPLHDMEGLMDEFGESMHRVDGCLRRANESYTQMLTCYEAAEANAAEMSHTLKQVLAENGNLLAENERLQVELEDERHKNEALQERVADLERQAEVRKFNPELRAQNDKLLAENEELRRDLKKNLDIREAFVSKDIYDKLKEGLDERDKLATMLGCLAEWVKMLDTMRTMFRKMPDLTSAIDELMRKHLNMPESAEKPAVQVNVAVGSGGTAQITDKEIINNR